MTKKINTETNLSYEKSLEELAKDLHDGVSQQLVAILWKLESLKNMDQREERSTTIDQLTEQLRGTINEIQQIIYGVKPVRLDEVGLVEAVRLWAENQFNSHNIQFQLFQKIGPLILPRFETGQVYRILQEGVNNILCHAKAKRVTLTIQQDGTNLILDLTDDGRGFDEYAPSVTGLGLQTMRERAQILQGELLIQSKRGVGTSLKLIIPYRGGGVK